MTSMWKTALAGACALGLTAGSMPAQAAWVASPAAVTAPDGGSVQKVGWRERRGYRGGGYHGGRRYYGHRHRGGNTGGYLAAGALGLATGAIIAGAARDRDYDDGYYAPRRVYVDEPRRYYSRRCEVVRWGENRYGEPVRIVRYRPC